MANSALPRRSPSNWSTRDTTALQEVLLLVLGVRPSTGRTASSSTRPAASGVLHARCRRRGPSLPSRYVPNASRRTPVPHRTPTRSRRRARTRTPGRPTRRRTLSTARLRWRGRRLAAWHPNDESPERRDQVATTVHGLGRPFAMCAVRRCSTWRCPSPTASRCRVGPPCTGRASRRSHNRRTARHRERSRSVMSRPRRTGEPAPPRCQPSTSTRGPRRVRRSSPSRA